MKNKFIIKLVFLILIIGLLQITSTSSIYDSVIEDIQIHSEKPISPILEITIPIENPTNLPDLTYYFVQITPIKEEFVYADIFFKVENKWISVNNLRKEDVTLYVLDNTWQQLSVSLEKEDKDFAYYKAKTSKIGMFAIAKAQKLITEPVLVEKQPIKEAVKSVQLTPILIFVIIILSIILIIELLFLSKYQFFLIFLAFAISITGLAVQQPVTKDILLYGLVPISIAALILSFILATILSKLKEHRPYPYVRNMIIAILALLIFITSTTTAYTKEILIYAVLPLAALSILIAIIPALLFNINSKLKKNIIYTNVRNLIISLIPLSIFVKLLAQQSITKEIFYFGILPLTLPPIIVLSFSLFKKNKKEGKIGNTNI